eukprot:TRINITY_DN63942_c0_g1_i1.p1 TRINITY_DN63942_c0_g1~~TRINITY_DN63942_c0_g1_i1.p1  ORF type:complete len:437 (+),score=25.26 TRINITY_DN63942_c0_g1_i1:81-1313(+)
MLKANAENRVKQLLQDTSSRCVLGVGDLVDQLRTPNMDAEEYTTGLGSIFLVSLVKNGHILPTLADVNIWLHNNGNKYEIHHYCHHGTSGELYFSPSVMAKTVMLMTQGGDSNTEQLIDTEGIEAIVNWIEYYNNTDKAVVFGGCQSSLGKPGAKLIGGLHALTGAGLVGVDEITQNIIVPKDSEVLTGWDVDCPDDHFLVVNSFEEGDTRLPAWVGLPPFVSILGTVHQDELASTLFQHKECILNTIRHHDLWANVTLPNNLHPCQRWRYKKQQGCSRLLARNPLMTSSLFNFDKFVQGIQQSDPTAVIHLNHILHHKEMLAEVELEVGQTMQEMWGTMPDDPFPKWLVQSRYVCSGGLGKMGRGPCRKFDGTVVMRRGHGYFTVGDALFTYDEEAVSEAEELGWFTAA